MTIQPHELSLAPPQVCGPGGEWAVQAGVSTPAHQDADAGTPVHSYAFSHLEYFQKLSSFS